MQVVYKPHKLTKDEKRIKLGSGRVMIKSSYQYLNLLEWLHVRFGHINPELIKHLIKHNILIGSGVTYEEIKSLKMGLCLRVCMHACTSFQYMNHLMKQHKEYDKDFIPCSYCKGNETLKARADSHPREKCFYDTKSPFHRDPCRLDHNEQ
jgi:hypothetical protein